jgi:hypothetical protein
MYVMPCALLDLWAYLGGKKQELRFGEVISIQHRFSMDSPRPDGAMRLTKRRA